MKPTITAEELLLQILSTCLLISSQGTWLANLHVYGHVSAADVRLYPFGYWDLPEDERDDPRSFPSYSARYASRLHHWTSEEEARANLQQLLTWIQGYLDLGQEQEVPPCAA